MHKHDFQPTDTQGHYGECSCGAQWSLDTGWYNEPIKRVTNLYFPTDWAMLQLPALTEGLRYIHTLGREGQPVPTPHASYAWGLAAVDHAAYSYIVERSFINNGFASRVPTWVYELPQNPYTERGGK